jgi:hypothetical protein
VNVVVPVPELLAVTVTVCAVPKFDGVKVSDVGESVSPVFPLAAMDTVKLAAGALDRARAKVPVLLWLTVKLDALAVIEPPPPLLPPLGVQVTDVGATLLPE